MAPLTPRCLVRLGKGLRDCPLRPKTSWNIAPAFLSLQQVRGVAVAYKAKDASASKKKSKKKTRSSYLCRSLKDVEQFALLDAIRYIRAFEAGKRATASPKYELHVKLRTLKNGPVVRNRVRLPHPVKTNVRVCVIAPRDSVAGRAALAAGATLVGDEAVFEAVRAGRLDFDHCLCQVDSLPALNKAGLGRILGPKGLMPSAKMGTVVQNPAAAVREMVAGAEYRERVGVVRLAIGQLRFTPEQLQRNIRFFIASLKKDLAQLSDRISKDIHEVVLSSTHSPGFSLNGDYRGPHSLNPQDLVAA